MNFKRYKSIVVKELIQLKRDRSSFAIALIMPIVMTLLLGYSINLELPNSSIEIVDKSNSDASRELIDKFKNDDYFNVTESNASKDDLKYKLDKNSIQCYLYIAEDFRENLNNDSYNGLNFVIDGSNPTTAKTIESKGTILINTFAKEKLSEKLQAVSEVQNTSFINISTDILYNSDLRTENYTIPGLIGVVLQNVTLLLTAFSLVREREKGTIEQLLVSPLTPAEIILGKLTPFVFIGFIGFLFSLALGLILFNVPVAGNLMLLIALGAIFVFCSLALGILISTISKTQFQSMLLCMILILPSILLSGFIFPVDAMPTVVQVLSKFLPLTYFLNIIRGIITKGVGASYLISDISILSILSLVLLALSIIRYKKKAF